MKVTPIFGFCNFGMLKNTKNFSDISKRFSTNELKADTVSFSSNAKYIKKYKTLPDEIKAILSPKDAIEMFKDMERIAQGKQKREKIGQGSNSKVFVTPWLEDYYVLILKEPKYTDETVYSKRYLGDSVWSDDENDKIQLIKGVA